jgi:hypothetical protein
MEAVKFLFLCHFVIWRGHNIFEKIQPSDMWTKYMENLSFLKIIHLFIGKHFV